jgi:predicted small lipoprotein YifL
VSQSDHPYLRIALIGALITSVGLSACGRKGPLDPPPGASYSAQQPTPTSTDVRDRPVYGPDGKVLVPAGPRKPIPLDVLLN